MSDSGSDTDPSPTTAGDAPFDPESTSAADADWLADLRARAKSDGSTVTELLAQGEASAVDIQEDTQEDGDTITADSDVMDAVRAAVEASNTPTSPATPAEPSRTDFGPPEAADIAAAPKRNPVRDTSRTAPRWEPPPRLAPSRRVDEPSILTTGATHRQHRTGFVAALVIASVVLTSVVVLLVVNLFGADEAPPNTDNTPGLDEPVDTVDASTDDGGGADSEPAGTDG